MAVKTGPNTIKHPEAQAVPVLAQPFERVGPDWDFEASLLKEEASS
jgi:hypothetical protein